MNTRQMKALKALAVFVAFSFAQVYVQAGLPNPDPGGGAPQNAITAKLITKGNQPIIVNGNPVGTGATLLTGATIETPDQVGATIDLGDAGVLELQPNSKIQIDFDQNGNVRVKVMRGCVLGRKKANVLPDAETVLYTDNSSETTDNKKKRRHVAGCFLPTTGQLGPFAGSAGGIGGATLAGVVIGGTTATIVGVALARGGTTSDSTPGQSGQ